MDNLYELEVTIKKEVLNLLNRVGDVPDYLKPQVNISNDFASPFIDIGFDGSLYYVVRERGIENERIRFQNIGSLLFKVFETLTFSLAITEELKYRENNGGYSLQKVYSIQNELMKKANPNWIISN